MQIEQQQNFIVRQALREDSRSVWEIRRHPTIQQASRPFDTPFEDSDRWFEKKYFPGQDNHCFVLEARENKKLSGINKKPVQPTNYKLQAIMGYCRYDFDQENKRYEVSIAIYPKFHGKGLGYKLLKESTALLNPKHNLYAEIPKNNMPSMKLFQKGGYVIVQEDKDCYHLTNKD